MESLLGGSAPQYAGGCIVPACGNSTRTGPRPTSSTRRFPDPVFAECGVGLAGREYNMGERSVDDQDKPRPRAPTLAGVGPSSAPPVVGAVARPPVVGPSEVTTRMIFEPPSDAE